MSLPASISSYLGNECLSCCRSSSNNGPKLHVSVCGRRERGPYKKRGINENGFISVRRGLIKTTPVHTVRRTSCTPTRGSTTICSGKKLTDRRKMLWSKNTFILASLVTVTLAAPAPNPTDNEVRMRLPYLIFFDSSNSDHYFSTPLVY